MQDGIDGDTWGRNNEMHVRDLRVTRRTVTRVEALDAPTIPISGLITATLISANLWMAIAYSVWSVVHLLH